eukprot:125150_1
MIVTISIFEIFSIIAFAVIFETDFSQMSIQVTIDMDHSNPYQHIHPIKSSTKLLNNHTQLSSTCIENVAKIDHEINIFFPQVKSQPILHLKYHLIWLLNLFIMHLIYFTFRKYVFCQWTCVWCRLFNKPLKYIYDIYNLVINACALNDDLKIMPKSDPKQRLSLARAVYSNELLIYKSIKKKQDSNIKILNFKSIMYFQQ